MSKMGAILGAGAVMALGACGGIGCAGAAGCAPRPANMPFAPSYEGIETRLLDGELVNFRVTMRGARGASDLEDYAECAAAQYALIRGYGFARHLRTNVAERSGLWQADAVYTVSAALPDGRQTLDAEVVTAHCADNGIPTV